MTRQRLSKGMTSPAVVDGRIDIDLLIHPGFDGVVGAVLFEMFRPKSIKVERAPGVRVWLERQGWVDCDGRSHDLPNAVSLPMGDVLTLRAINVGPEAAALRLVVHGSSARTAGKQPAIVFRGVSL